MTPPVSSALPRFNGPAQARQRMRLIAAIGMLAIAAITAGGVASLTAGRSMMRDEPRTTTPATGAEPRAHVDWSSLAEADVEGQVERAEREVQNARVKIRNARRLGLVDERTLDELERRLDETAGRPPVTAIDPSTPSPELPTDRQPRAL